MPPLLAAVDTSQYPPSAPGSATVVPASDSTDKSERGQFYTMADPFTGVAFRSWMNSIPDDAVFLEPFAGANNLVRLLNQHYSHLEWQCFDIEPAHPEVSQRDTLRNFPRFPGRSVAVITNPPYLARNSASRRGLTSAVALMGTWDNLYKKCLHECLSHAGWVGAIVPESLITSGDLRARLSDVVSLPQPMFVDTEVPVCLALFTPQPSPQVRIWRQDTLLGTWDSLVAGVPTVVSPRIHFNHPLGQVGLWAVDSTTGASIRFGKGSLIPDKAVTSTARSRSRILVDGLFRRRLDFAMARRLLSAALESVEGRGVPHLAGAGDERGEGIGEQHPLAA